MRTKRTIAPRPHAESVVYTPERLASAMVSAIGSPAGRWLEPSFGDGIFLRALQKENISPDRIRGIDLETKKSANDCLAQVLRGVDFLTWSQSTRERFDNIIGNPPYVPIHRLHRSLQRAATEYLDTATGNESLIRARTNYWCAFVAASIPLLKPRGNLCFVLPAALEYANYADPIRRQLIQLFETVEVHRSCEPLFEGVQDGCIVLIARHCRTGSAIVRRHEYANLDTLIKGLSNNLQGEKTELRTSSLATQKIERRFSDIFDLRIGAVTGAVKYFVIDEETRAKFKIPPSAVTPVVSRARHLTGGFLTRSRWGALRDKNQRVWLFRPPVALANSTNVQKYLSLPLSDGGCDKTTYKISIREPWYQTPLPPKPHGFISGMSSHGPWIALSSMRDLTATNTLYTVRFRETSSKETKAAICLSLLTSQVRAQILKNRRLYADQLMKFEPGELARLVLPPLPTPLLGNAVKVYKEAIKCLLSGDERGCTSIADTFFSTGP